ncbi:hypothetical protein MRB53_028539 [Persea americana]|uniref:Uncharacterized protein n=1 Tax=Persea americana TaxID=3435 RepID=A0ACC2KFS2_PERAE|nr:hypothetical protein MRB53_028539 [Persea americana]
MADCCSVVDWPVANEVEWSAAVLWWTGRWQMKWSGAGCRQVEWPATVRRRDWPVAKGELRGRSARRTEGEELAAGLKVDGDWPVGKSSGMAGWTEGEVESGRLQGRDGVMAAEAGRKCIGR